jgi:uncharacterized protein (DUF2236 family)
MNLVTEAALEAQLAALGAGADPRAGLFGPGSFTWRIEREAALFLGAGRAILLQLAHPWVAAAVADHSRALDDPIGRFHGTFATVFALIFGSVEEALQAARRLYRRHETIRGTLPGGGAYAANDRSALAWVYATLIDTALLAYALVLPLSEDERHGFYRESFRFAACFGLAPPDLPPDWPAFEQYCQATQGTLAVDQRTRAMAQRILAGAGSWIIVPRWYHALTAGLVPDRLRDAFGLAYGAEERRLEARALSRICAIYPRLPARLRFVAPYHEAQERLMGRAPGLRTRAGNRLWIGRPSLSP